MRVKINQEEKTVDVECSNISDAGRLGFTFACNYVDLVANGWLLYFYCENDSFFLALKTRAESIATPKDLVDLIQNSACCHNCCCNKGE